LILILRVLIINSYCVINKKYRVFRNPTSFISKTKEGKTSKEGMIGNQREQALWLKTGVRKKKEARREFPSLAVFFYSNPNS